MSEVILTKTGFEKLSKELDICKRVKRKEVARALTEARAHGDLSENAEYDAAKQEQAVLEARIAELQNKLSGARVVNTDDMPKDVIRIGAKVVLKDSKTGEEEIYILVGSEEADYMENKISVNSPIAQGLFGHKLGETVEITVPSGILKYKIIEISWD